MNESETFVPLKKRPKLVLPSMFSKV